MAAFVRQGKRPGIQSLLRNTLLTQFPSPIGNFVQTEPSVSDKLIACGLAAAAGFFAAPMVRSGQAGGAEYQFGVHATAIHQSQNLTQVWGSLRASSTGKVPRFVLSLPQVDTTQVQPQIFKSLATPPVATNPVPPFRFVPEQPNTRVADPQIFEPLFAAQGNLILGVENAPQDDPSQIQPQVWKSARAATVSTPVSAVVIVNEQRFDLNLQPQVFEPMFNRQGQVPARTVIGPQSDPTPAANVFASPIQATAITPNPAAVFWTTAPQALDLTQQSSVWRSLIGPSAPQRFWATAPELRDLTQQSQFFAPSTPAPIITGVTVFPQPQSYPQEDPTQPPIAFWTPSTFSESAPPVAPTQPIGAGGGGRSYGYRCPVGYIWDERRQKCRKLKLSEQPNKQLKKLLDDIGARMLYGELTQPATTPELKAKAEKLVAPFTKETETDWAALEADTRRTQALIKLWLDDQKRRRLISDDDDWMMLS